MTKKQVVRECENFDFVDKTLSILQEFYMEFFGIFMPGFVAVGIVIGLFGGLCFFDKGNWDAVGDLLLPLSWSPALSTLFVIFVSYMVGAIVLRRDTKRPDGVSAYLQWKRAMKDKVDSRLAVQFPGREGMRATGAKEWVKALFNRGGFIRQKVRKANYSIDYPYPHLRKFLLSRHLNNLARYVSWCQAFHAKGSSTGKSRCDDDRRGTCSKHLINTIKHCIRMSGRASLISDMTRNECHIRMLCSFWYVLRFSLWVIVISFQLVVFISIVKNFDLLFSGGITRAIAPCFLMLLNSRTVQYLLVHVMLYIFVRRCRVGIEKGFHYVRTREVVTILEAAYILEKAEPNFYGVLLATARSDASQFRRKHCRICENKVTCYAVCANSAIRKEVVK